MKTAISIPDDLFEAAEGLAEELHVSRSQLYARAVAELLARLRDDDVTRRLDEVYSQTESRLDPVLERLQVDSLPGEEW
jgi:predicted transcriptional regulator